MYLKSQNIITGSQIMIFQISHKISQDTTWLTQKTSLYQKLNRQRTMYKHNFNQTQTLPILINEIIQMLKVLHVTFQYRSIELIKASSLYNINL